MKFSTKRGFTIWEILVVIVVISVGLLSVVVVLTNGMKYVQKTRQKIVALNLAREGMEAVYQIRDTNRTRRAGVKDGCWLKINPLVDEGVERCIDDARFTSGAYALQRLATGGQEYFALTGPRTGIDLSYGLQNNSGFSLCQQSGYWNSCMGQLPTTSEGKYFREIEGLGLYLKNVPTTGGVLKICTGGMVPGCGDGSPKEFRFCSKVVYIGDSTGEVKLCGVITNFKGK
ncbi:MAG: prepilin-type N-terminal cleavage/methylation domain-containing protein [candidate division SR1 bacterium]|nr:prepilin-type N-terminal cleavage/methylation domain-containing protein [candidate division SR1 bacterium]